MYILPFAIQSLTFKAHIIPFSFIEVYLVIFWRSLYEGFTPFFPVYIFLVFFVFLNHPLPGLVPDQGFWYSQGWFRPMYGAGDTCQAFSAAFSFPVTLECPGTQLIINLILSISNLSSSQYSQTIHSWVWQYPKCFQAVGKPCVSSKHVLGMTVYHPFFTVCYFDC